MEILTFPHPFLKKKAKAVKRFNSELNSLIKQMLHTMREAGGIGLAATQVGVDARVFVIELPAAEEKDKESFVFINPKIKTHSGNAQQEEGCLSLPGVLVEVARPAEVCLAYQDIHNQPQTKQMNDLFACCAQHELDHLNGVLILEYLPPLQRQLTIRKLKKQQQQPDPI